MSAWRPLVAGAGGLLLASRARRRTRRRQATEEVAGEAAVSQLVHKVASLRDAADELRANELRTVISSMKELKKPELQSIAGEVDGLLFALVDAIAELRSSAVTIRNRGFLPAEPPADDVDSMMEVHVIGLSHHSAPVEVRERLAVAESSWTEYARYVAEFATTSSGPLVPEVAVISTCNRFEIIFSSLELKSIPALEAVRAFLRQSSGLSREELDPYLFTHSGEEAIRHLFHVSSGLDSLVLGEAQILAQVKACLRHAQAKGGGDGGDVDATPSHGMGGKVVSKLLSTALHVGKVARTKTKVGQGAVSVSSAAVELMSSQALETLQKHPQALDVSVIGAGKMSRLLLLALYSRYPDIRLTLVNRSAERAQRLLDEVSTRGGSRSSVAGMDRMWETVAESDVVFFATSSEVLMVHPKDVAGRGRDVMLVDICVPRNVAKSCGDVDGVALFTVDDLKKIQEANNLARQAEVTKAKELIEEEVSSFKAWQSSQSAAPYLAALQSMAEATCKVELRKLSKRFRNLEEQEMAAIDRLTRQVVGSLFRPVYYSLKEQEPISDKKNKIWALKTLFNLEPLYKRQLLATTPPKELAS